MPLKPKLTQNWFFDLSAGFNIFLIAIPLSVGIALASGAPPAAGLIAAIIGGIVGSFLGGGHININGPAAGLIVIILNCINTLGANDPILGFQYTLAIIVIAGLIQVAIGLLGWARIGLAFPSSVIQGMLVSIGLIILIKQTIVVLDLTTNAKNIFEYFFELPTSIKSINVISTFIGFITLLTFLGIQKIKQNTSSKFFIFLPAPLMAILVGVIIAHIFNFKEEHLIHFGNWNVSVGPHLLLSVPQNFTGHFHFPNFSQILHWDSIKFIITLALVASLESTLSAHAVDKIDPLKRQSQLNRDLWSKGICNVLCGLIGGLPIITEIVRSSANISNGARSILSNFFHGLFILLFTICFPWILNEIPLSALAALLIVVGWRLSHPTLFKNAFQIGPDHMLAFATTIIITLAFDLLLGIFAGLLVEIAFAVVMGTKLRELFNPVIKTKQEANHIIIESHSSMIFCNMFGLRNHVQQFIVHSSNITLDLSRSPFIDHTVMDFLSSFRIKLKEQGIQLTILTSPLHHSFSKHQLASKKFSY